MAFKKGEHCSPKTEFKKGCVGSNKGKTGEKTSNWKGGLVDVICQYCGEPFKVKPSILKSGRGKYHSNKCKWLARKGTKFPKEWRTNISEAHKGLYVGENSPRFKGGEIEARKRFYDNHKNDLKYRLNHRIRMGIWHCLKNGIKNGRTWQSLIGYTYKQLKQRLQSTMPEGYNWQDFLDGKLEIDHIIPISEFNFERPEDLQFQQCWALSNLRLITKIKNRKKSGKLIKPFQLGLAV